MTDEEHKRAREKLEMTADKEDPAAKRAKINLTEMQKHLLDDMPKPKYGPMATWRDNLRRRQELRQVDVYATNVDDTPFGKVLAKNAPDNVGDVFLAEADTLQYLEAAEPESETEVEPEEVCRCFRKKRCRWKGRQRKTVTVYEATREIEKKARELKWKRLTAEQQTLFREAMDQEWES